MYKFQPGFFLNPILGAEFSVRMGVPGIYIYV